MAAEAVSFFWVSGSRRAHLDRVISFTTLDTPHYGSVLADSVILFDENPIGGIIGSTLQDFGKLGILGLGAYDMSIDAVKVINNLFPDPPSLFTVADSSCNSSVTHPFYYSTSADAECCGRAHRSLS
jgi:hypothetical protein